MSEGISSEDISWPAAACMGSTNICHGPSTRLPSLVLLLRSWRGAPPDLAFHQPASLCQLRWTRVAGALVPPAAGYCAVQLRRLARPYQRGLLLRISAGALRALLSHLAGVSAVAASLRPPVVQSPARRGCYLASTVCSADKQKVTKARASMAAFRVCTC